METFIVLFLSNLFVPTILFVIGYFLAKYPPKEVNGLLGYRTNLSKKNKETWNFANTYCGKLWMKLGSVLFIISAIIQLPFVHQKETIVQALTVFLEILQLSTLICSIFLVEFKLRHTFDQNGHRKE